MAAGGRGAGLRTFMLTVLVVDDRLALLVISFLYAGRTRPPGLFVAAALQAHTPLSVLTALLAPLRSGAALRGAAVPAPSPCRAR